MFVYGKSGTIFFPSDTLIYGISRDGYKNFNIRTCEHMVLGQLRMGARQAKNALLLTLCVRTIFTTWKTLVDTLVEGCCLHKILVILESAVIFWYR